MSKAQHASQVKCFTDIPNIGKAMADDFILLGFKTPQDLAHADPLALYHKLCVLTHTRQDPCVLDTFMAAIDFMQGGSAKPWWAFTEERKTRFRDL